MRVAVADAMRRSWTRPLATVALPVCLDALLAHRKTSSPKPGPALYALLAKAGARVARWMGGSDGLIGIPVPSIPLLPGVAIDLHNNVVFYYAVLSEVSPPTALSPFAAAAITGAIALGQKLLA